MGNSRCFKIIDPKREHSAYLQGSHHDMQSNVEWKLTLAKVFFGLSGSFLCCCCCCFAVGAVGAVEQSGGSSPAPSTSKCSTSTKTQHYQTTKKRAVGDADGCIVHDDCDDDDGDCGD